MSSLPSLKKELSKAAKFQEPAMRAILIASLIAEALRTVGQDPVLVGGSAVEFYTQGGYATADIDMVAEGGPQLQGVMLQLGFERYGKDFVDGKNKIYVEFPARSLGPTEKDQAIEVNRRLLRIISLEDLIVDRLCAFKFWKSEIEGLNVLKLLEAGKLDEKRLSQRAEEESVRDALVGLKTLGAEVIRKKIPQNEATSQLKQLLKDLNK